MMTHAHWMQRTKRNAFTPRSKLLENIDDALKAYEKSSGIKTRVALFDALIAWLDAKGAGWKTSTRNSKIETGGNKGTVEVLLDDVLALDPQFKIRANKYAQAGKTAVAQPVIAVGNRVRQKNEDNQWFDIPLQTEENSCGPCSVRLVAKLVKNTDVGEDYLQNLVELAEEQGAYKGTLGDGGVVEAGGAHVWDASGNGTWLVPEALKGLQIANTLAEIPPSADLIAATSRTPAIGVVAWDTGGLHYVVSVGKTKVGDKVTILDPYYGIQTVPIVSGKLGKYKPIDPTSKVEKGSANWHPWVCSVN